MMIRKTVHPDGTVQRIPDRDTQSRTVDLSGLVARLGRATHDGGMDKVKAMMRAGHFPVLSEVAGDHVAGVVKSPSDPAISFACRLDERGDYTCCSQDLELCDGLRGQLCEHLLLLLVTLAQSGAVDAKALATWADAAKGKKPVLDRDVMSGVLARYEQSKGA